MYNRPIKSPYFTRPKQLIQPDINKTVNELYTISQVLQELKDFKASVIQQIEAVRTEHARTIQQSQKTFLDTHKDLMDTAVSEFATLIAKINSQIKAASDKVEEIKLAKQGEPGKDADEEQIVKTVLSKIKLPKAIKGEPGTPGKKGKDATIDHGKIIKTVIQKLDDGEIKIKSKHIDGWQDPQEVVRRFWAMGGIRGGGDTVAAGSNISITTNTDGKKVIAATGALSLLTATGTVDNTNKDFVFASKPTLIIVNGSSYRENNGWTWTAGTLTATLANPVGTGGDIYGLG